MTEPATKRVLVLGGRGFIGRHAVQALSAMGTSVVVGSRSPSDDGTERRVLRMHEMTEPTRWSAVLEDVDAVLNCVGILRQRRGERYEAVHHHAPAAAARACRERGLRFVHVSALGLEHPHTSRFLTSKRRGEAALRAAGGDWVIARPSLLDGEGGFGARWLRGVAALPIHAVPMDARGRIAACMATDVGEALAKLATVDSAALDLDRSREFDLGGETHYRFAEYVRGLRAREGHGPSLGVPVPGVLARIGAHLCDLVHFSPFSFGHYELLRVDNVPKENRLGELLGRAPTPVIG